MHNVPQSAASEIFNFQAYAELEKDTPGQIFGITFKSDGKSDPPISDKFTQRPNDEDAYYEAHDVRDTLDYKKNVLGSRFYFAFGMLIVFVLFLLSLSDNSENFIDYERDRTLEEQRQSAAKRDKGPFDEA